jgi:hypothetical protein
MLSISILCFAAVMGQLSTQAPAPTPSSVLAIAGLPVCAVSYLYARPENFELLIVTSKPVSTTFLAHVNVPKVIFIVSMSPAPLSYLKVEDYIRANGLPE